MEVKLIYIQHFKTSFKTIITKEASRTVSANSLFAFFSD